MIKFSGLDSKGMESSHYWWQCWCCRCCCSSEFIWNRSLIHNRAALTGSSTYRRRARAKTFEYINNWHNIDSTMIWIFKGYGVLANWEICAKQIDTHSHYMFGVENRPSIQKNQAMEKHMHKRGFEMIWRTCWANCTSWLDKGFTPLHRLPPAITHSITFSPVFLLSSCSHSNVASIFVVLYIDR